MHRNRGICTAPRAHTWIDFTQLSLDEWDKYTISLAQKKTGDDSWTALSATSSPSSISGAIERGMLCLADAPDALGEGSHIVNVLFSSTNNEETTGMVECPGVGHAMRVTMDDNVIFNIAGPENDAQGVLQVAISSSMAGSESEFLPEVYKELFQDESLKNPLYVRFKKRQEERLANKNNE